MGLRKFLTAFVYVVREWGGPGCFHAIISLTLASPDWVKTYNDFVCYWPTKVTLVRKLIPLAVSHPILAR